MTTVDASASVDPDGTIVRWLWEFGDGATASTRSASHTYAEPGTYRVSLAVQDDRGAWSVDTSDTSETASNYDFNGFLQPVENEPTLNLTRAGSAVPVKFRLGGDQGLNVLADGGPVSSRMDCATGAAVESLDATVNAGASNLQYDAASDTYSYVWKTSSVWAGTCRQLSVTLADGTAHTASFKFRT